MSNNCFYILHKKIKKKEKNIQLFFIAHINHIRRIAGVNHVGLGAGYDGISR